MNTRKNKYIVVALLFCCLCTCVVFSLNVLAVNDQTGSVSSDELKKIQNGDMIVINWTASSSGNEHVATDQKLIKTSVVTDDDGTPWLQITIYPSKSKEGCSGSYTAHKTTVTFTISANSGYENLYVKWDGDAKGEWTSDSTGTGTFTLSSEEGSTNEAVKKIKLVIAQVEFPTIYLKPANQEGCFATVTIGTDDVVVGSNYNGSHVFETATIKTHSASSAENYVFDGWSICNETGTVYHLGGASADGKDIEIPLGTWYLAPVFRPSSNTTEPFKVVGSDTEELYHYLDIALRRASELSGIVIVTSDTDVVLASGKNCVVPYGTTLLIPCSETDTGALNASYDNCAVSTTVSGTRTDEYCALVLPSDFTLSVEGTVLINAVQGYSGNNTMGCISGKHGLLTANGNIIVNDGGKFYSYGLLTGSGTMLAKAGSDIYQLAEIADMRGGSAMLSNYLKFFPVNQLYLQNIQIKTTYLSGCRMYGSGYVHTSKGAMSSLILLIGASNDTKALFAVSDGNLCFGYDGEHAKTIVELNGTVQVQAVELTVKFGIDIPISSVNYECPLSAAFDVNINEGGILNVTNKFKILPGCVFTIKEKGTLNILSGASLYLFDSDSTHFPPESEAAYFYRRWPSTSANKSGVMPTETNDGSLIVNGILNVSGNLYTSSTSDYSGIGHSIKTNSSTGVINYAATSSNTTSFDSPNSTGSVKHYFTKPYGYMANGESCDWKQFSAGTYYSNGSAWYTHKVVYQDTAQQEITEHTAYYVLGSDTLPDSHVHPECPAYSDSEYLYNVTWSGGDCVTPESGAKYFLFIASVGDVSGINVSFEQKYYLEDYVWLNGLLSIPAHNGEGTLELVSADGDISLPMVNGQYVTDEDGAFYIVRQMEAKVLSTPIEFSVTYTNGDTVLTSEMFVIDFQAYADAYIEANKDSTDTQIVNMVALVEAMKTYGDAAKEYFDYKHNSIVPDTIKDLAFETEVKNSMSRTDVHNGVYTLGGSEYYLYTSGANFEFAEHLAMIVNFHFIVNDGTTSTDSKEAHVDLKTLFGAELDNLVKVGLLVQADGEGAITLSTQGATAYVLYGTADSVPNPSQPVVGGQGDALEVPGITDSTNLSVAFDLTEDVYLSRFQIRPYVQYEDENGKICTVYGRQFNYGLEDYIDRKYAANSTDAGTRLFNNLLVATWEYANASALAFD